MTGAYYHPPQRGMKRILAITAMIALCGCDKINDAFNPLAQRVVFIRGGTMKESTIAKLNGYCYGHWYGDIDKVQLKRNGSAYDDNLNYTWELYKIGGSTIAESQEWFDANCKEPTQ